MFAEKFNNGIRVVLSKNEAVSYNLFETLINSKSEKSQTILTNLFLSACEKANVFKQSGSFKVEISVLTNGCVAVIFTNSAKRIKLSSFPVAFKFSSADNMLLCIKALYLLNRLPAKLYFYNNKYYITALYNKKFCLICKEFAKKQSTAKFKAVQKSARLINNNVINNFGKKLNIF